MQVLVAEDDGHFVLILVCTVPMESSEYELYVRETETGFYMFSELIPEAPEYQDRETFRARFYFPEEVFDDGEHDAYLKAVATSDIEALTALADEYESRFVGLAQSPTWD